MAIQLLSIKAKQKRDDLLAKAAKQDAQYRAKLQKGDFAGAQQALKRKNQFEQQARYSAYRMVKHTENT